jgi:lipoprotein-anchoring transpeptidase ErfK/SrfK
MAYGSPGYTDNGSHGCVHLPAAAMAWLYAWAPVGTTVSIDA